jgi:hypothetical protein
MFGKQKIPTSRVARTLIEAFEQKPVVRGLFIESGETLSHTDYQRIDREEIWLQWVLSGSAIAGEFPPGDPVGMDLTDYLCIAACKYLAQTPGDALAEYVEKNLTYITSLQPLESPNALGDAFCRYSRVEVSNPIINLLLRNWAAHKVVIRRNFLANVRDNYKIISDLQK